MNKLVTKQDEDITVIELYGNLNDDLVEQLRQAVSALRQQNKTKLLILGHHLERITSYKMDRLHEAIRHFRALGGVVALAGFHKANLQRLRNVTWSKFLNVFNEEDVARQFLSPVYRKKASAKRYSPVIFEPDTTDEARDEDSKTVSPELPDDNQHNEEQSEPDDMKELKPYKPPTDDRSGDEK